MLFFRFDYIRQGRICLIMDREVELESPPCDCSGCGQKVRGEVSLDPLAKEGIGHLNFQRVALAAEPEPYSLTKPESKLGLTDFLGYRRSQGEVESLTIGTRRCFGMSIAHMTRVGPHRTVPPSPHPCGHSLAWLLGVRSCGLGKEW
jgi:hypothetical protein